MTFDTPESRLLAAGHVLPRPTAPRGAYAPFCRHPVGAASDLITISGQVCRVDGVAMVGICNTSEHVDGAREASRVAMLNALAVLASACAGALPATCQVVRLRGFIRSGSDFGDHPAVLDGASEILRVAYPAQPLPARTAIGVSSLPSQALIEIELDVVITVSGARSPAS